MTITGINPIDESRLREVIQKMGTLGAPTIRAILHQNRLYAIEGTHRLRAAKELNLRPIVVVVADESTNENESILAVYDGRSATVGQLRATHIPEGHIRPTFVF